MVDKVKLIKYINDQVKEIKLQRSGVTSKPAKNKYNWLLGILGNLLKDIDDGNFD